MRSRSVLLRPLSYTVSLKSALFTYIALAGLLWSSFAFLTVKPAAATPITARLASPVSAKPFNASKPIPAQASSGGWLASGSMTTARYQNSATLLQNGKILVAGGSDTNGALSNAELFDPANGSWSVTSSMNTARSGHTSTLLQNSKVLVTGGATNPTAEIYDPLTGQWSSAGTMQAKRTNHTATLLQNGKVLVVGGTDGANTLASAELYDPTNNSWSAAPNLATARSSHTTTLLQNGKVLVTGGASGDTSAELYDPATNQWSSAGNLTSTRSGHTATLLPDGKVLVAGGFNTNTALATSELYDPAANSWAATGALSSAVGFHTAALLPNGKVLVVGGKDSAPVTNIQLYDPASGQWKDLNLDKLATARYWHTSLVLPGGRVVVTGGYDGANPLASTEIYDYTGQGGWRQLASMNTSRSGHTATLLPNGKVLVTGGVPGTNPTDRLSSAELYDPSNNQWSSAGNMSNPRVAHTATLLPNGKVLVAGGYDNNGTLNATNTADLYDPATNTWTPAPSMSTARGFHTATLLANSKVLVAGSIYAYNYQGGSTASAEIYDPTTNSWSNAASMAQARGFHTATLLQSGKVLVAGGGSVNWSFSSAELYDPDTNSWSSAASMAAIRINHVAALLPNGKVLVAGGSIGIGPPTNTAELYDPATNTWSTTGSLNHARYYFDVTVLPNGQALVAGGSYLDSNGLDAGLTSAELYNPNSGKWTTTDSLFASGSENKLNLMPDGEVLTTGGYDRLSGVTTNSAELYSPEAANWTSAGYNSTAHLKASLTSLPDESALLAGGLVNTSSSSNVERFYPATNSWAVVANMNVARSEHRAVQLPNGKVLVTGGRTSSYVPLASAEIYDPVTNTWILAASMNVARYEHTETLLANGKVLVAGGTNSNYSYSSLTSAEIYDPVANTWTVVASMNTSRYQPTATLLSNGKVLVAGGINSGKTLASTEIYDPVTNTWTITASMSVVRAEHTATLLPNGKVLVAGGSYENGTIYNSAELYDPVTNTWTPTAPLNDARAAQTATLLKDGKVLLVGGDSYKQNNPYIVLSTTETYDPITNSWTKGGGLFSGRSQHQAVLLNNGSVLVTGGVNTSYPSNQVTFTLAEIYDPRENYQSGWQPQVSNPGLLATNKPVAVSGRGFTGVSEATGGNGTSASNYPLAQLRSINTEQQSWLSPDPANIWSATSLNLLPAGNFPTGPALLTVYANGIPSQSRYVTVTSCSLEVTNPVEDGSGSCGTLGGAITLANNSPASAAPLTITFTPGLAITVNAPLPTLNNINGARITLGGECPASTTVGRNVTISKGMGANSTGLSLGSNVTVKGVGINGFDNFALDIQGANNNIGCSWLGDVNDDGTPGNGGGIRLGTAGGNSANHNSLGETGNNLSGNVISGNSGPGIQVNLGTDNSASFTLVGYKPDGTPGKSNIGGALCVLKGGQLKLLPGNRLR